MMNAVSKAWDGALVRKWLESRVDAARLEQVAADRRGYAAQDDYDKAAAEEWVCRSLKMSGHTDDQAGFAERVKTLLEFFFQIHDPTTPNRQGNDRGVSYRSAIFYTDERQKAVAQETIADVDASGLWPGKVVTELSPVGDFWEAEPEHQDHLERKPNGYTCHFVRPGWTLPRRASAG